jgi:hypothetical protein
LLASKARPEGAEGVVVAAVVVVTVVVVGLATVVV